MNYWQQQKQLLKNHSFQFYLVSAVAGTFASGLTYIVTFWLIVHFHPSVNGTLVGVILFSLPSLVLSAHMGVIIDHYDRKKLIIVAESLRVIKFLVFGVFLLYQPSLAAIYILVVLAGCFAALYGPLLPAFVHELVAEDQLVYANTNINMAYELGNIIGRGIIVVAVLSLVGPYEALFIVAALYLVSALTILPVKRHHTASKITTETVRLSFIKSIIDGYRYLFTHTKLRLYALIQSLILMNLLAAPVLVAPYVKNILLASSKTFGICEAVISAGALLGAFTWSFMASRIAKDACVAVASLFGATAYILLSSTSNLNYALLAFFLLGFSWGSFALIMTTVQTLTEKAFQGRVQAAIRAAVTIIFILFAIFLYGFDKNYSAQHAFLLLAGLSGLIFLCVTTARG